MLSLVAIQWPATHSEKDAVAWLGASTRAPSICTRKGNYNGTVLYTASATCMLLPVAGRAVRQPLRSLLPLVYMLPTVQVMLFANAFPVRPGRHCNCNRTCTCVRPFMWPVSRSATRLAMAMVLNGSCAAFLRAPSQAQSWGYAYRYPRAVPWACHSVVSTSMAFNYDIVTTGFTLSLYGAARVP